MGKSESDSADAAREFFGRAANGDWDAVIVSGSRFDMLDLSQERKEVYLKRRRMEFLRAKEDAQENGGSFSVKKLEEEVKKINEKLSKLHSSFRRPKGFRSRRSASTICLWTRRITIRISLRMASLLRE